MRRATDRAEAAIVALALIAFLVIAPLAAVLAGGWAAGAVRHAAQQHPRQVSAVLLTAPRSVVGGIYEGFILPDARARWTAPDGAVRTGNIPVTSAATVGSRVRIWTDASGRLVGPPPGPSERTASVVLAVVFAAAGAGLVLLGVLKLARWVLDTRRMAAWDADWRSIGPQWSGRR